MINGIGVYYYFIQIILGIIAGMFSAMGTIRYRDEKRIFSRENFKNIKLEGIPGVYLNIAANVIIYLVLLYFIGIAPTFIANLNLIKYMLISPLLIITFNVDLKIREIPDRVTLFLFEIALINILVLGFINVNLALDAIYGGLIGGGIFLSLAVLGRLFYGKEAMGMGDVKLMGPLGSILGVTMTLNLTLLAFIISSIIGILVLIIRKNKNDDDAYVPFGPFLVISAYIMMIIPNNYIIEQFLNFTSFISESIMKLFS